MNFRSKRRAIAGVWRGPSLETALTTVMPELLLEGTPWLQMWREHEARLVVLAARTALAASAVGLVLHHYLVDLPLGLEPAARWTAYRFGSAAFYLALLALTFIPRMRRGALARLPLVLGTVVIGCLQAKTVQWLPSVPYVYAFVLVVAGVLLTRQSMVAALGTFGLCYALQWLVAWRYTDIPSAKLASATMLSALLVMLFRGRMASDVKAFLTEKRELDAQKKLIETQIELDRVKTNFFTNVSHELRTPLTLIIAPIELLLYGDRPLAPEVREDLELVLRNAQRLLREINTLLELSRLDARRELLRLEEVDVAAVVRSLVDGGRALAERRHVRLSFEAVGTVPPFRADREKVEKIVLNLLSNAIRFTDGTEAAPGAVAVRCGVRADRFWCSVEDTGIGIPQEDLPKVFDRFHKVESGRSLGRGGSGIGLALVKQLAEFHMGAVQVESRVGRGSTFTFELPTDPSVYPADRLDGAGDRAGTSAVGRDAPASLERLLVEDVAPTPLPTPAPAAQPGAAPAPVVAAASPAADPGRPLVLVVDDNRELLDYVARQLAPEFRVHVAASADEGEQLLSRERPALVVCDLMMPGRPGTELLRAIRRDPDTRHLPFILLTAKADLQSRIEHLEEGADDFLSKPFNLLELRARIRSLLLRGRLERELAEKNDYLARVNFDLVLSKRQVFLETMEAFALAVEAKDPYTHGHSRRVSILAERLAGELGLPESQREAVQIAGILHDIGKIGIPELVLEKPGRLTAEELEVFKRHSRLGYRIVSAVKDLEEVGRAILHHHERFEGNGYPDRLAGEDIPLLSRVLAVCDAYDAMTSDRPYRASIAHSLAVEEIASCAGTQFDPEVARAFVGLYERSAPEFPDYPPRLRDLGVLEAMRGARG